MYGLSNGMIANDLRFELVHDIACTTLRALQITNFDDLE